MPSTGGLLNLSTPQTGSPTTADSGLVSPKITKTRSKTPRQRANVNSKQQKQTEGLRVSQKRQLVTDITRRLTRFEPIVSKVVRLLVDKNIISNQDKLFSYTVSVPVNTTDYDMSLIIQSKTQDVNIPNVTQQLHALKLFPHIEVKPHT